MVVQRVVPSWLALLSTIKVWMHGVVSTPRKCGNDSDTVESRRAVLSWLSTSITIKVPAPWKHGGLHRVGWMH